MDFVLDASVAIAWSLQDEASPETDHLLEAINSGTGFVPAIWPLEVANALAMAVRQGRIKAETLREYLEFFGTLSVEIESSVHVEDLGTELALARAHSLSVYDASYLALAMRRSLPLATLDSRLRAAAKKAGIALVVAA